MKKDLLDFSTDEFKKYLSEAGEKPFRAEQIFSWAYSKHAADFSGYKNIPKELLTMLEREFIAGKLDLNERTVSRLDGTVRYSFKLHDGKKISAVFLPKAKGSTICISTQAGCPVGCSFCATGNSGFERNLSCGEILGQIVKIAQFEKTSITDILLMGMGEPLLNYDNVVKAVKNMLDKKCLGLGRRHITLSTVGIVPGLLKLSKENIGVRLAVSLHSSQDATRRKFIPERTVKFTVAEIVSAAAAYIRENNTRLTIEYVLVKGKNDSLHDAQELINLIKKFALFDEDVRINLIPYNEILNDKKHIEEIERVNLFRNYLHERGVNAITRQARGSDIGAACGQLGF